MDILWWALEAAGQELVSCAGGWVKTLKCFLAMLSWPNNTSAATWTSSSASFGNIGTEGKAYVKSLNVMAAFFRVGLVSGSEKSDGPPLVGTFPLWHVEHHILPKRSNCFAGLNLFGLPRDEEGEMYEDREDRQSIYHKRFRQAVDKGLDAAKREAGEVGRAAAGVKKVLIEGMHDYKDEGY